MGSSPRMRGSQEGERLVPEKRGIIPAHAGLTCPHHLHGLRWRDHPRACGAHKLEKLAPQNEAGSSPRMRGSHVDIFGEGYRTGIIPAHAGLTTGAFCGIRKAWDHPRACGAHKEVIKMKATVKGSSPRMRGSPDRLRRWQSRIGIIPAHAGLTPTTSRQASRSRDHPRACGAHYGLFATSVLPRGSSPRMRGSHIDGIYSRPDKGIIPAHAGLTAISYAGGMRWRDHPRACGAHSRVCRLTTSHPGSSPRMRGSRLSL